MKAQEIRGKNIVIIGAGVEGKSAAAWIGREYPDASITIRDRMQDGETYLHGLENFDTLVRSPGVPPYASEIAAFARRGGHVTSATNIFFSRVTGKTVGITGTKGKSTTAGLIAHIASQAFSDVRLVGNIGNPMLDALDGADDATIFVIELSSHQLADVRYSPDIAVVLGIVPEHLDYYPDFRTYGRAKANIALFQSPQGFLVYNPDNPGLTDLLSDAPGIRVTYGDNQGDSVAVGTTPILPLADMPFVTHRENVRAAVAAAGILQIPFAKIRAALLSFHTLPHRLEYVATVQGIRFFNDSLATIPEAAIHAIRTLGPDVKTLIAGGYDRGLSYDALGAYLRDHPISTLILFPDTGKRIWDAIGDCPARNSMRMIPVSSMEEAVDASFANTPEGTVCLLSPASASYNLFANYADRGDQFKRCVRMRAA